MINYYLADGWAKFSEEDIYSDGCQPNTGSMYGGEEAWKAGTIEELIEQLLSFTGGEREDIQLNSCDEVGRIDISVMEDENGNRATRQQIEDWKEARIKLWDCIYTFRVERIQAEDVNLEGALA